MGRGARGGGGMGGRGAAGRGGGRGTRGGRGGVSSYGGGNGAAAAMGKRKMESPVSLGQSKKRLMTSQDSWGAQPIAQQPLSSEQEWYEDSFDPTWG